jgi:hypothetical protein
MSTTKATIYKGDTFKGVINLRLRDSCDADKVNPFVIEAGSTIEIRFPGTSAPVVLSTANVGEINILDTNLSTLSYEGAPAKSALMKTGNSQAITVVVTQGVSTEVYTFQMEKFIDIKVRAN